MAHTVGHALSVAAVAALLLVLDRVLALCVLGPRGVAAGVVLVLRTATRRA